MILARLLAEQDPGYKFQPGPSGRGERPSEYVWSCVVVVDRRVGGGEVVCVCVCLGSI